MIVVIVMMMREGSREREGGRERELEGLRRRCGGALRSLYIWWFYLVKAAREECHCTSFEKIIQYLGDIS